MEIVSCECIILKNQDFQERDRLVTFLTREHGRLKGITKGSRKLTSRGVGSFEPFSRGVMHYTEKPGRELVNIRKCDPLPPYLYLQQSYHKIVFAGYLSELVELCTVPPAESPAYYALLLEALEALCAPGAPRRLPLIRLRFELKLLELLGYQPDWEYCCVCGEPLLAERDGQVVPASPQAHRFDPRQGGVRCPACTAGASGHTALPVLPAEALAFLAAWRRAGSGPAVRPSRPVLEGLETAVTAHLTHHLERQPRSLGLLPGLDELDAAPSP